VHTPVASPSEKFTSPAENFNKISAAGGSESRTSLTKKRKSVDISKPRSSQAKISSVTGKLADDLSARKSVAEPQRASCGARNSPIGKQKITAGEQHHGAVVDSTTSSSHNISHSSTTTPRSGRLGVNKATGSRTDLGEQKSTEMAVETKGKRPKQESSTKVSSVRESVSKKQSMSARGDSRPASRLSEYVYYIIVHQCQQLLTLV